MKWNLIIAGLAVLLPVSAFTQDQDKKEKTRGTGGGSRGGKPAQAAAPQAAAPAPGRSQGRNVQNQGRSNAAYTGQGHFSHGAPGAATVQRSRVAPTIQSSPNTRGRGNQPSQVSSSQRQPTQVQGATRQPRNQVSLNQQQPRVHSNQQNYNRANRYGGLWFPQNSHSNWNQNQHYYWNRHHYRWYDGGWLIIDGGYTPYYPNTGYLYGSSIVSNVQARLTDLGYYRGPIDGDIGPITRDAIASYQSDYGLSVTGRINTVLLHSLGL